MAATSAGDRSLLLHDPPGLPLLESLDGLSAALGGEDGLGLGHAGLLVHSFELDADIPQPVGDASLNSDVFIDTCAASNEVTC